MEGRASCRQRGMLEEWIGIVTFVKLQSVAGSSVILVHESFSRSAVAYGWFEKSRVRLSGGA